MLQHENIFIMNTAFPVCLLNLKVLVLFITYLTFTYMAASSHVGSGSKDVSAPGITPSRRASIRGQSGFLVIRTLKALMLGCCSSVQHSTQSSSVSVGKNKQKRWFWCRLTVDQRVARLVFLGLNISDDIISSLNTNSAAKKKLLPAETEASVFSRLAQISSKS